MQYSHKMAYLMAETLWIKNAVSHFYEFSAELLNELAHLNDKI